MTAYARHPADMPDEPGALRIDWLPQSPDLTHALNWYDRELFPAGDKLFRDAGVGQAAEKLVADALITALRAAAEFVATQRGTAVPFGEQPHVPRHRAKSQRSATATRVEPDAVDLEEQARVERFAARGTWSDPDPDPWAQPITPRDMDGSYVWWECRHCGSRWPEGEATS